MEPQFRAEAGAAGWQISNPPILSAAPLVASLELFQRARFDRLREKSIALTGFLEHLLRPLQPAVEIITPSDSGGRGCQLSIRIKGETRGNTLFHRLMQLGAVCDWRAPDVIRVAPVPLYNRFEDVLHFSERLRQALRETS
jgi:kynureninase